MLAHAKDSSLQPAGTGRDLQLLGDPAAEAGLGHMAVPVTVTPMGEKICPSGQYKELKAVMKYVA